MMPGCSLIGRRRTAPTAGTSAVAKVHGEDGYCAIQCKFYREGYRIQKGDIDSFLSSSQVKPFTRGLIIDTTGAAWSENAEVMLEPPNMVRLASTRLRKPHRLRGFFERDGVWSRCTCAGSESGYFNHS